MTVLQTSTRHTATVAFAAPTAEWPSDAWWVDSGVVQLNRLIEEGLGGASDMRVAQARFTKAQASVTNVNAARLPSLTGQGDVGVARELPFPQLFWPPRLERLWAGFGRPQSRSRLLVQKPRCAGRNQI